MNYIILIQLPIELPGLEDDMEEMDMIGYKSLIENNSCKAYWKTNRI